MMHMILGILFWWSLAGAVGMMALVGITLTKKQSNMVLLVAGPLVWLIVGVLNVLDHYTNGEVSAVLQRAQNEIDAAEAEEDGMIEIADDDRTIRVDITPEKEQELGRRLVAWCKKHDVWSGESICQMDAPQIDAAPFLSDLVDEVLKPDVKWND